jgi:DnaJ-class molecular chaperone
MADLSVPNAKPGPCAKCKGSGVYVWGAVINGKPTHSGPCHSCRGTGHQTAADIKRNEAFNRHQIRRLLGS